MGPNILVFMSDNRELNVEERYYSLAAAINFTYCQKHGYDFIYYVPYSSTNVQALYTSVDPNTGEPRHASWSKILSAMRAVELSEYDYVVYIDSDCIFKNFDTRLENIISQHEHEDKTMIIWNDLPWYPDKPCCAFFIISCKNKCKALSLLREWYMCDLPQYNKGGFWEQDALCNMLNNSRTLEGVSLHNEMMFFDEPGQFLRHVASGNDDMRVPYFTTFIKSMGIDYTNILKEVKTIRYDTGVDTEALCPFDVNINRNNRSVLVTILTSGDIEIFELCFKSVLHQSHKIDAYNIQNTRFHPVVIVNTTNPTYFEEVVKLLRENYNFTDVIQSESNGRPGKGHNSEIEHFKNNPQYDWIFPVDGDDVLYPTAFLQIATLLNTIEPTNVDVLLHLGLDRINKISTTGSVVINKGVFMHTTFEETNLLEDRKNEIVDPFDKTKSIDNIQCPGRIFMLNRKAVSISNPAIRWDEDSVMLEDFPPYIATVYHNVHSNLRVMGTSNRYIYMYNQLNDSTVTTKFVDDVKHADRLAIANRLFRKSLDIPEFTNIASEWESAIRSIPFVATSDNPTFKKTFRDKIYFVQSTLVMHYFDKQLLVLEKVYAEQNWTELIAETKSMFDTYSDTLLNNQHILANIRMNLGVAFFSQQQYALARQNWIDAAAIPNISQSTLQSLQRNLEVLDKRNAHGNI